MRARSASRHWPQPRSRIHTLTSPHALGRSPSVPLSLYTRAHGIQAPSHQRPIGAKPRLMIRNYWGQAPCGGSRQSSCDREPAGSSATSPPHCPLPHPQPPCLTLKPPARLNPIEIAVDVARTVDQRSSRSACTRLMGLFTKASVAIDGSKFKAVNTRDKNFTRGKVERRRARLLQRCGNTRLPRGRLRSNPPEADDLGPPAATHPKAAPDQLLSIAIATLASKPNSARIVKESPRFI